MISNSLTQEAELYPVTNGYINSVGKLVLNLPEKTCCPRSFSEGLAAVRFVPSDSYDLGLGYIDQTGELVIPPRFFDPGGMEGSENFSEGLAAATLLEVDDEQGDSLYGYINKVGEMVIAPQFYAAHPFSDGIAVVEFHSQEVTTFALINQQGEIIFNHPQAYEAFDSSEGLAAVCIHELWGFVDATGQFVIEPQFPKVGRFSHGLAPAIHRGSKGPGQYRDQYGYIDHTGRFVIQPQFIEAEPFAEGLSPVKVGGNEYGFGGEWGYIDTTGQFVIPPQFEDTLGAVASFSEGLAAVTVADLRFGHNGKTGYIDRTGHFVIPPQFNSGAGSFSRGLAYVGVMLEKEIQGMQIPNPPPSNLSERQLMDIWHSREFPYGGGKSGYINQQGNFVWEEQYAD
jgi:hypothetical protein